MKNQLLSISSENKTAGYPRQGFDCFRLFHLFWKRSNLVQLGAAVKKNQTFPAVTMAEVSCCKRSFSLSISEYC